MAFSNYGDSLDQCMALSDSLLVLKQYRNGSIRNEQLTEAVSYLQKRFRLDVQAIIDLQTIEDEPERMSRYERALRKVVDYLDRNHRREFSEAVRLWD